MDNKIEVFKNEQFGEIRTALIENEPWFVAVDVCRALEIGNSSQAISRLDADEKMITLISNEGNKRGNPNMTVVNEPGLYTLILSSRKPEAKAFKRWITHDVIPMIRKTGGYMTDSLLERIQAGTDAGYLPVCGFCTCIARTQGAHCAGIPGPRRSGRHDRRWRQ